MSEPGPAPADVAVLCVTHNSTSELGGLLDALGDALGDLRAEIVFVDSGSSDGTPDAARALAPDAVVLSLDANRGFAAGINAGVQSLRSRGSNAPVLVINPDVRLFPGSVGHLLGALDGDGVGACVPRLVDEHGELLPSLRRPPTAFAAWVDALLGSPLASKLRLPTDVIRDPSVYEAEQDVTWATGGAVMFSMACLDAVGEWDESFFMYEEEVDYLLRTGDAGFRVRFVPAAGAARFIGSPPWSPWPIALMCANRVRLLRQREGMTTAELTRLAMLLGGGLRYLCGRREFGAAIDSLGRRLSVTQIMEKHAPGSRATVAA